MHDGQLEDRLRAVLRGVGDQLPLTITPEELERWLALRRRERVGRRFGYLAAGVAVVALGSVIAVSSGWLRAPGVGSGPSPATSSVLPTSPVRPTSGPTTAELDCSVLDRTEADQPPSVVLGVSPGDSIPHFGALGAYRLGDRQAGEAGDWTTIDAGGLDPIGAGPPAQQLAALAGSDYTCLTDLDVEAVPIEDVGASPVILDVLTTGPARSVEFALPPVGKWLVRVRAEFLSAPGVDAWSETFFRVDASNPAASLGPVLGSLPLLASPPATIFVDEHSENLEPSDATGLTEAWVVGRVQPRPMYALYIVCLGSTPLRWAIGHEGQLDFLAAGEQRCDGTFSEFALEEGLPTDDLDVILEGDPAVAWRIRVATIADPPSFIPPALRLRLTSEADGPDDVLEAFGRCVITADLPEPCGGEWSVLDGAKGLLAAGVSSVTMTLGDGWEITEARLTAVVTDQVRVDALPPEYSVAFAESGGSEVTVPIELGRGSWILRVALNGSMDGETYGAHYDFPLVITE